MSETIITEVICLIFAVLTTIITSILLPLLSNWLKSKTENEKLKLIISDITTTVQTAVNKYEQTTVAKLKATGEWNTESMQGVLDSVIDDVVSNLLDTTIKTLENNRVDVSEVVERYVESYIQSQK